MAEFADVNHGPKAIPTTDANMPLIELLQRHDPGDFLRAVTEAVPQTQMAHVADGAGGRHSIGMDRRRLDEKGR